MRVAGRSLAFAIGATHSRSANPQSLIDDKAHHSEPQRKGALPTKNGKRGFTPSLAVFFSECGISVTNRTIARIAKDTFWVTGRVTPATPTPDQVFN